MKKILKYSLGALFIGGMVACSPEEFSGADPNATPTTSANTIVIDVNNDDPTINTATLTTQEIAGQYPIWYIDGNFYSTLATATYSSLEAGQHEVELFIANRNGISNASVKSSFEFTQTKVDYSAVFSKLCDKNWKINYTEVGHMGCGEPGSDGSNWWSAQPNDKADWGIYDDVITFAHTDSDPATSGTYTYDPGEGGTVYVNTGCSLFAESNTNDNNDFMAQVSGQTASYTIETGTYNNESALYIHLDANTLFPYIPNDGTYADPLFRIENLTSSALTLVCDNGDIAWRFVFTSKEVSLDDEDDTNNATMDWDASAANNLWTVQSESDLNEISFWFADDNWSQVADPTEYSYTDGQFSLTTVACGSSQWQGQVHIKTAIGASKDKKYDIFFVVEADDDVPSMTVKLTDSNSDDNYFFADKIAVKANTPYIYKVEDAQLSDNTNADALNFVLDFGGTPAGTHVKIHDIYMAVAVSLEADDPDNLWTVQNESDLNEISFWFADDNWSQVADPTEYSYTDGQFSLTTVACGSSQWQGQVHIKTAISASQSATYAFKCIIEADDEVPSMTVKLTDSNSDDNYFFADKIAIKANTPYIYKVKSMQLSADADALNFVLDFGGTPAGTHVKLHDIVLKKIE